MKPKNLLMAKLERNPMMKPDGFTGVIKLITPVMRKKRVTESLPKTI